MRRFKIEIFINAAAVLFIKIFDEQRIFDRILFYAFTIGFPYFVLYFIASVLSDNVI